MKSRLVAALPLLTSCGLDSLMTRKIFVEVPVEDSGRSGGSQGEDWNDEPDYPGEGDTGASDVIPGDEEPEDAEIVRIADEVCEELWLTRVDVGEALYFYGDDDTLHSFDDEGLHLFLRSEIQKEPDWDVFACMRAWNHPSSGSEELMGQFGSLTEYHEVDPESGEWLPDPQIRVHVASYPELPEYVHVLELAMGYVNKDTDEISWFYDARSTQPLHFYVYPQGSEPLAECVWC